MRTGIGSATAKMIVENGPNVVKAANDQEQLEIAVSQLSNTIGITADIRNLDDANKVIVCKLPKR